MHLVSQARYARDRIDIPHAGAQPNPFWEESKVRLLAKALFYMVVCCYVFDYRGCPGPYLQRFSISNGVGMAETW